MGARQSSDGAADDCPITPPPSQAAPSAPLSLPLAALVASPPPPPVAGDMSGGRSPTIGVSPFVSGSSASDPAPPPPLSHIPFIPFAAAPAVGRGRRRERSLSPTSSREGRRRGRRSRRRRRSSRHSRSSRYSRRSRSSRWRSPSSSEGSSGVSEESVRTPRSGSGRLADGEVSRVSSLASVAVHREAVPVPAVVPAAIPVPGFSGPSSGGGDGWAGLPRFPVAAGAQQLMTLVSSSVTPATWQAHGMARPVVWLLGHSYIFWAAQRAECRPGGRSLGFREVEVHWRGLRGLRWSQVLPEVVEIGRRSVGPVILVLHAGGNDLCSQRMLELMALMRSDLERFPAFFPELVVVWSEVVPRVVWHGARDGEAMERCRRTLNARMSRFVRSKGGVVVRHWQLEGDNSSLMRPDGVHLTEIGLDIFLSGLQDGIEQAFSLLGGGRSPV
ncbi:uncharacterized protein LOC122944427 isoform X2 [Bufo gargarizans]|uniref:uncharacterized protein LOC122944427 isoform X2 n=1 Tax=Bufo gargarizans TaxID=30331 RepID=UPI001CF40097|nr:uncharacterized protein LOC122944427 isoform X2 [Bufo gargarizans]XP_044158604.1 uncharacterized protein LOC122944427 isoform X2 [Bufo gargarizans]